MIQRLKLSAFHVGYLQEKYQIQDNVFCIDPCFFQSARSSSLRDFRFLSNLWVMDRLFPWFRAVSMWFCPVIGFFIATPPSLFFYVLVAWSSHALIMYSLVSILLKCIFFLRWIFKDKGLVLEFFVCHIMAWKGATIIWPYGTYVNVNLTLMFDKF